MRHEEGADELDRLFARLEPIPPPLGLVERAMAEGAARRARQALWLVLPGYAIGLLAIALLSFAIGRALVAGGAGDLLSMAILDPSAISDAPVDFVLALVESLSWWLLAAFAVACLVLIWCARRAAAAGSAHRVGA